MKRGICVGLLLLSMVTAAPAATYYVARSEPGASDASDGLTPTASGNGKGPWLTIQKAADMAQPGDTVLVGKGTYAETIQLKQSRVTFRSLRPSERPRIDGSGERQRGICIAEGQALEDVVIEGFEIAGQTDVGIYAGTGQAKRLVIRDNLIHHIQSQGVQLSGTGHLVCKNVIYMIGNNQEAMGILLAAASDCRVQGGEAFTHLILVPTGHKVEGNVRRYEFSVSDDNRTYRRIAAGENNDSGVGSSTSLTNPSQPGSSGSPWWTSSPMTD